MRGGIAMGYGGGDCKERGVWGGMTGLWWGGRTGIGGEGSTWCFGGGWGGHNGDLRVVIWGVGGLGEGSGRAVITR